MKTARFYVVNLHNSQLSRRFIRQNRTTWYHKMLCHDLIMGSLKPPTEISTERLVIYNLNP